jgi:hypothetical protein
MAQFTTVQEVFGAIQRVKTNAPAFCTNFFPVQKKLESWIEHGELFGEISDDSAFFLRKERDLCHLFFAAADISRLGRGLDQLPKSRGETMVTDIVGDEKSVSAMRGPLERAGFRAHAQLLRMARLKRLDFEMKTDSGPSIETAGHSDARSVMDLLEGSFDRRADQLPTEYEIEAAIATRQILVIRDRNALAAMLHFETQGMTSTVRYWVVAEPYQSRGLGAALMRHYLFLHANVKRFLLWVNSENRIAIQKYGLFGYSPDGLVDDVLIRAN